MRANTQRTARGKGGGGMKQEGREWEGQTVGNRDIRRSVEERGMGAGNTGYSRRVTVHIYCNPINNE